MTTMTSDTATEMLASATAYKEMDRPAGSGPLRIDTALRPREDMYSALFIAQVKPAYKRHLDEKVAEKNRCLEILISEVAQRDKDDCIVFNSQDSPGRNLNQLLRPSHFDFEDEK